MHNILPNMSIKTKRIITVTDRINNKFRIDKLISSKPVKWNIKKI